MKNLTSLMSKMACLTLALFAFAACSDDDDAPSYSTNTLAADSELKAILVKLGYTFNGDGNLLLDDLANTTTSLDLSGTKISQSALAELSILPNLTEVNLSNNGYGPVFYVDSLPAQITGLDLQGNDVYDLEGLVDASVVNDEVVATVLHSFTKLYLPASCKYNVEDLMPFYTQNEADGKMADSKGVLTAYNTLREIPDEYFRAYLQTKFASLFADETHIDISKPLGVMEQGEPIYFGYDNSYADADKIASYDGIECFINNPYYKSFAVVFKNPNEVCSISHISPRANIKALALENIDTPQGIDFSKATGLVNLSLNNNSSLTSLNLANTLIGAQNVDDIDERWGNGLNLYSCGNLASISLPESDYGILNILFLYDLPSLKALDLSDISGIAELNLLQLPNTDITYPELKYVYTSELKLEDISTSSSTIDLAISENVFEKENTKTFITKYRDNLKDNYRTYKSYGGYRWSKYI